MVESGILGGTAAETTLKPAASGLFVARMAARLRKTHQADVREKIRAGLLVKHLEDHALGKRDMQKTQVTAALGLLRKVVPDLQSTTIAGDPSNPLMIGDPKDVLLRGLVSKPPGSGTPS